MRVFTVTELVLLCGVNVKSKVRPRTGREGLEKKLKYSSTLSLTSALDGSGQSMLLFDRFTPGQETRYPFYRRLGGLQGQCGRVWKISPHRDFFLNSLAFCLYCIRTGFCVLIVLHFAFCLYCKHTTQTSMPPRGIYFLYSLVLCTLSVFVSLS